jgi:S1-C subfamily serine protease
MSLLKFFFTEKCPNCSQRIEKSASFCRHCGSGRAESWRQCTACGVSVAADSQFCWSCNASLSAQPRDQVFSDRWRRTPGVFATRIAIETPKERLRHGIQVDEGTQGTLYSNGIARAELGAGYHTQTSFWDRLTGSAKTGGFVEAVLTVTDPVSCFVSLSQTASLHTRDHAAVEAAVMVKVQLADQALFTRRMLPTGTDIVRDDDLMLPHTSRIAELLRRHLSRLGVDEVARSTELRHELEAALGAELPALLEDYGLHFRGVEDVRIDSPEISRVREAEGDLSKTSRELTWAKVKRELEQSHKLGEIKDEFAFKEQLDQWTHEYTLTSMEREHITKMRRIQLAEAQGIAQTHATGKITGLQKDYEIEIKRKDRDWEDEDDARDLKLLDELRKRQFEAMEKLQALKLQKNAAATQNTIDLGQGLKDVPSYIAAGVLPGQQGMQVVSALEALRPQPNVTIIQAPSFTAPQPSFMPSFMSGGMSSPISAAYGVSNLEALAQRYLPSVGLVVTGVETDKPMPMGTAWIAAGHSGMVVTNAHVAEGVLEAQEQAGLSSWVIFSGQSQPCRVRRALLHPEYAQSQARGHPVPSYDVAVLELEPLPPHAGLPIANRSKLFTLRELQSVAYLGFPMENLAGSGTNMERPKAIAKKGTISSLEDWMMRHSDDPAQRQLIKHDLGVAGGASGSPMFDESGDVIGIISAGNMERIYDSQAKRMRRMPNGVLLNFAQRIDVLLGWMGW